MQGHTRGYVFSPPTGNSRDVFHRSIWKGKPSVSLSHWLEHLERIYVFLIVGSEPWLSVRKAHNNRPSHIGTELRLWEGVDSRAITALMSRRSLRKYVRAQHQGLPGLTGAAANMMKEAQEHLTPSKMKRLVIEMNNSLKYSLLRSDRESNSKKENR